MNNKIYITGHKNPDTDSIASAIVYADLKSRLDDENKYIPLRLGELNQESKWVLEQWNQSAPKYVENLKPTISDLHLQKPLLVSKDISLYEAANYLQPRNRSFLPIVDEDEKLIGIITLSNLTKSYMNVWDDDILHRAAATIENIVDVLSGEIVHLPENPNPYDGRMLVYASEVDEKGHVSKGDVVIVGNRRASQLEAIDRRCGIIIVSSGHEMDEDVLEKAKKNNVIVIKTKYNSFMVARLIPQSIPISHVMTTENLTSFTPYDLLEDVSLRVANTRYRNFPIVDTNGRVVAELNRNDLLFDKKKQLILVDHNEENQSIDDRDNVDIIEIIDHHRVANINTNQPIYFRNVPVGCTSTILATMYKENGITPSKEMAGLMASAIISDTLLFRSPTTTITDKIVLKELAEIAEIDLEEYAAQMFSAGTSLKGVNARTILLTDSKKFDMQDQNIRVSQTFTTNLSSVDSMIDDIKKNMKFIKEDEKLDFFCLFITDIFGERSLVITDGKYSDDLAEEFGSINKDNGYIVDGLLSRKKQFIPAVNKVINNFHKE